MPAELSMPKLSDSEADAVVLRWLKAPGEGFRRGDGLLEVETDKATVVYEAEEDGTIEAILVAEGETVAVGQPIATLAGDGAPAEAPATAAPPAAAPRLLRARTPTRRRWRGGRRSSSASRSTTWPAPAPAAGSRARTCSARWGQARRRRRGRRTLAGTFASSS